MAAGFGPSSDAGPGNASRSYPHGTFAKHPLGTVDAAQFHLAAEVAIAVACAQGAGQGRKRETSMEPAQTQATQATAAPAATERLNFVYLAILGVAMGLVAPFTGLAWPIAIFVGMIVGLAAVERSKGIEQRGAVHLLRALGVVIGVIAMLILGAIVFGLIALVIVALASLSERVSATRVRWIVRSGRSSWSSSRSSSGS